MAGRKIVKHKYLISKIENPWYISVLTMLWIYFIDKKFINSNLNFTNNTSVAKYITIVKSTLSHSTNFNPVDFDWVKPTVSKIEIVNHPLIW